MAAGRDACFPMLRRNFPSKSREFHSIIWCISGGRSLRSILCALMMVLGGEEDGVAGGPALGAVAEVDGGQASGYAA